jgi:erythromycin esterase-like protein
LQAVAVNTAKGTAILGSDCAHIFRNYQEDWPSAIIVDLVGWMKTYKLRARASSIDLLFPGHDPIMSENYPELAEGVTRLV